jgi:hypothetical protein
MPRQFDRPLTPRWRLASLALAVMLALGGVPPIPLAQAQTDDYQYLVDVLRAEYTVCLDATKDVQVRILLVGSIGPKESIDHATLAVSGKTTITGKAVDPSVGDFTAARAQAIGSPDPRLIRPGMVAFTFKPKKIGETEVIFTADVDEHGQIVEAKSGSAVVVVKNCPYNVKITSQFRVMGEDYKADMDWLELSALPNGQYAGKSYVAWYAHWQVIPAGAGAGVDCSSQLYSPTSQVSITGHVEHSFLVLNVVYDTVKDPYWHVVCGGVPPVDRREFTLSPAPLSIIVPATTGGSSEEQPQDLIDTMHGNAVTYEVVPLGRTQ